MASTDAPSARACARWLSGSCRTHFQGNRGIDDQRHLSGALPIGKLPCLSLPAFAKEVCRRGGSTICCAAPELGEALRGSRARRGRAAAAQNLAQDLPVLGLRAAAVLSCTKAECPDDVIVEVTDG
jgi:hypothetical protein